MATVTWRYHCGICGDKRGIFGGIYFTGVYRCDECSDWEMNNAYEWYLEHLDNGGRALGHLGKGKEVAGKGQVKEEQVFWCCEKGKGKKGKGGKGGGDRGGGGQEVTASIVDLVAGIATAVANQNQQNPPPMQLQLANNNALAVGQGGVATRSNINLVIENISRCYICCSLEASFSC